MSKEFKKTEYGEIEYNKWIRHKTFTTFIEDVGYNPLVSKILGNISTQQESEMVFNMTQILFDFAHEEVTISFFIVDNEYPDIQLSFDELRKIFSYAKKFVWR